VVTSDEKQFVYVGGTRMAFVEVGSGDPIVFLHGNPTSSFLWRDVIPKVSHLGRCLAPDLIGMGDSDKLADSGPAAYTFAQHRDYLDGWFEAVGATTNVTLVLHDWGSALGFDWAFRHPGAVGAIAYMEAIVGPVTWADLPAPAVELFRGLRAPAGEEMILAQNLFVEAVLPGTVLAPMPPEVLDEYRRPFVLAGESRRPTLAWARQIPIDGEPADVDEVVRRYSTWMAQTGIPKLFVNAEPGMTLVGRQRKRCRAWPNQTEVTVAGVHLIQEDSGPKIGQALASWLPTVSDD
jgi:haloalkane dehalogenase